MLYYFLDIQLFFQSQLIPHREHAVSPRGHPIWGTAGPQPPCPKPKLKKT